MIFYAKRDVFVTNFMILMIIIIGLVLFLPMIDGFVQSLGYLIFSIACFLLCASFIIWQIWGIKYVFYDDYLLVKGGLMRSKIPYHAITEIRPTKSWYFGYRIISAKTNLLEINYKTGLIGSVIVSPDNKHGFIKELQKRCPADVKIFDSSRSDQIENHF